MLKRKIRLLLHECSRISASFFTNVPKLTFTRSNNGGRRKEPFVTRIVGFTSAVVGVFGAGTNCGGLNFNFSPHYSPEECYETNLKAMIVAMMMQDKLDEDEFAILMNSIQFVYQSPNARRSWCGSEMKNFMTCSENYGNFQDDRCKSFRKMLKTCLQSKNCAVDLNPSKITSKSPAWPYHSPENFKPAHLRKLPLSKCPPSTQNNSTGCPMANISQEKIVGLEPYCAGYCDDSFPKDASSCRPCECRPDDRAKEEDDAWLKMTNIPASTQEEINKTKKEESGIRCICKCHKDYWKDVCDSNVIDYEDWCRQQAQ